MISIPTTEDIRDELKRLYKEGIFREGKYGKTVEIQNVHFLADKGSFANQIMIMLSEKLSGTNHNHYM